MAPTHGRQAAVPIPGRRGESYLDVINRLRPILIELERQRKSVLLVTHLAVQRCLYSYFTGTDAEAIPYLPLPAGAVLELTPTPHGTQVRTHILLPDDEEARCVPERSAHSPVVVHAVSEHGVPSPQSRSRVPSHAQAAPQGKGSPVVALTLRCGSRRRLKFHIIQLNTRFTIGCHDRAARC